MKQNDTTAEHQDPWGTPGMPSWDAWDAQPVKIPTAEELQQRHAERIANLPYKGQPYSVSWCDSEKGWSECRCGTIWHYTSACRVPRELFSNAECDPIAGTHDIVYGEVLGDCHCGGLDPYIEHPCIGHDRETGEPLLGPSKFIDPEDKW